MEFPHFGVAVSHSAWAVLVGVVSGGVGILRNVEVGEGESGGGGCGGGWWESEGEWWNRGVRGGR